MSYIIKLQIIIPFFFVFLPSTFQHGRIKFYDVFENCFLKQVFLNFKNIFDKFFKTKGLKNCLEIRLNNIFKIFFIKCF